MVVNRISYHLQNSNWTQIDHELIMNIGGNILHGADLLQIFYSGLSKSNWYSLYCSLISMMFIKNNSLLPHSIWFQIGHENGDVLSTEVEIQTKVNGQEQCDQIKIAKCL